MLDNKAVFPLILSVIAGMSTVTGAFIIFFSKKKNERLITFSLAFSAGVMITISLTDLFISAESTLSKYQGNIKGCLYSLLFLIIGVTIAILINVFLPEENYNANNNLCCNKLYKVGFVSMLALLIHNLPEGIATYISGYENTTLGISIALAIALHNIPEGISIAIPIYYSTGKKSSAFFYTFLSGLAEPIGAFLAFLFLTPFINEIILAIIFAIVAGLMLYISFAELIPASRAYGHNKLYLLSLFLGVCIILLSHAILI